MVSLDAVRAASVQRGFSTFAELIQTTDRTSRESKTNQQEGNHEVTSITESIVDAQLYVDVGKQRHDE